MADIELVIKIPEEMKEEIDNGIIHFDGRLRQAVINGTPYETVTKFADRCRECGREKILDKIRAEIESKEMIETTSEREFYNMALNDVLQIIDKYRVESEDKVCK